MTSIGCGTRHLLFRFNVNFQTESFPKLQQHTSLDFKGCLSALAIAVPKSRLPANKVPKGGKTTVWRHFSLNQGAPLPVDAETFYPEGRRNGFAQHWRERKSAETVEEGFFALTRGFLAKQLLSLCTKQELTRPAERKNSAPLAVRKTHQRRTKHPIAPTIGAISAFRQRYFVKVPGNIEPAIPGFAWFATPGLMFTEVTRRMLHSIDYRFSADIHDLPLPL